MYNFSQFCCTSVQVFTVHNLNYYNDFDKPDSEWGINSVNDFIQSLKRWITVFHPILLQ